MAWYIDRRRGKPTFDYRRLRRAMNKVCRIDPLFSEMWGMICKRNTADNITRLAMADRLEEEGFPVEGKCLREYTTCEKPDTLQQILAKKKRKRRK